MKSQTKRRIATKIESFVEVDQSVLSFPPAGGKKGNKLASRMILPLNKLQVGKWLVLDKPNDGRSLEDFLGRMKSLASNAQKWAEENLNEVRNYRAYVIDSGKHKGKVAIGRIENGQKHRRQKRA